jgi:mono/diheme cytochrome c family protein
MSSLTRVEEVRSVPRFERAVAFTVTFALAAFCASAMTIGARAQDAPPGDAANGKRVYLNDNCFTCHGRAGQGGAYNGPAPALAKTAMPFEGFLGQIRNPSNDMPAYAAQVMSDQAVADIYAYMQSLPGPQQAGDIAILND